MTSDDYFEQHYVWQVYFEVVGPLSEITLSFRRSRSDGSGVKFDEDPAIIDRGILDLINGEDDDLVMDGFLACLPGGKLLSCALRVLRRNLLFFESEAYEHVFAHYDKNVVKQAFERRLFNTDGTNGDLLFIGGDHAAHATPTILRWCKVIESDAMHHSGVALIAVWEPVLQVYEAVAYTLDTEIHLFTRNDDDLIKRIKQALTEVATRYGFVLPPQ